LNLVPVWFGGGAAKRTSQSMPTVEMKKLEN